jgi:hypothetical protein
MNEPSSLPLMPPHHPVALDSFFLTRREFLRSSGMGFGALGLGPLLAGGAAVADVRESEAAQRLNPLSQRPPHFPAKAKHVIHIFLNGGASQVDTFDPKPALTKYHGKELPIKLKTERNTTTALGSPFAFKPRGASGIEISELFENTARHADDLCVIRSMCADVPNHEPSLLLMNCGEARQVRPSFGSWVTYGLGTENQNLPGFISMCPGYPIQESQNWQSGFLPGVYQGAYIDTRNEAVDRLIANIRNTTVSREDQRRQLDLLQTLNAAHAARRQNDALLEARIQSFELAYRMQMEAADAFDLTKEPPEVRQRYGSSVQGRQLLIARRLVERGVRFVQVWHGDGQPWDSHDQIEKEHRRLAREIDPGIAALLDDLKSRGLLAETVVMLVGEFGRTPTVEVPSEGSNNKGVKLGRDHNHYGFTCVLAGGGVKGGYVHGSTDEFGFKAVEKPVHVHDLHATLLALLGFDHEKLTYRFAGRDFRLTDVHGKVVRDIIA